MPLAKLARRRYAQQPSSLRTAHDARGKYGSELYAAASYGSMGILEESLMRFAPRDPTRRGRESRNLPSPNSTYTSSTLNSFRELPG